MTTSESKGRFFLLNESIRITNRIESIRIANWNALLGSPLTTMQKDPLYRAVWIRQGLELAWEATQSLRRISPSVESSRGGLYVLLPFLNYF